MSPSSRVTQAVALESNAKSRSVTVAFLARARTVLGIPLALLVILLVRVMRPIVQIRFGVLTSQRIGHLASNTEVYLCERDAGMYGKGIIDFFCHSNDISNHQLRKMWDRTLHVSQLVAPLTRVNGWIPGGKSHEVPYNGGRDIHGLLDVTPAHLSFTDEEEAMGMAAIKTMGIPDGAPFVCFHTRDAAYLKAALPDNDWTGYEVRDANIQNYLPAVENLTRLGYYCLRMGAVVNEPLATDNPMIIDYAVKYRTDFLDIYLSAKCKLFLGSESGIAQVSNMVFRRPIVYVNWTTLAIVNSWSPEIISIFKHFYMKSEQRRLGFREILESGIGRFQQQSQFEELGIDVLENTPQEISAVTMELEQRLSGNWKTVDDDEELQARFWSFIKPNDLQGVLRSRIGAEFLRQNRDLLD